MKKIIVKDSNREKIAAAIAEVQKKTREREVTVNDVFDAVERIENKLNIPKVAMIGIIARVDLNAQNFPNAYKYTPESTHFTIERGASGWYLVYVGRDRTRRAGHEYELKLTDVAKARLIERFETFGRW